MNAQLGTLIRASWLEGLTLIALLFIAMPIKYLAGFPFATKLLGSVHGFAFLNYLWCACAILPGLPISRHSKAWVIISGFIPFGFLYSHKVLSSVREG